jgi:hypothetical protein
MVYAVPLSDGTFGYVQAISEALVNVIDVAAFSIRTSVLPAVPPKLHQSEAISFSATWRQDLNRGNWAALGLAALAIEPAAMPNQVLLQAGTTVGVKHSDAGAIQSLLEAWHGLAPWNVMFDENYFDLKLAPGVRRPSSALVLAPEQRSAFRASAAANGV